MKRIFKIIIILTVHSIIDNVMTARSILIKQSSKLEGRLEKYENSSANARDARYDSNYG